MTRLTPQGDLGLWAKDDHGQVYEKIVETRYDLEADQLVDTVRWVLNDNVWSESDAAEEEA